MAEQAKHETHEKTRKKNQPQKDAPQTIREHTVMDLQNTLGNSRITRLVTSMQQNNHSITPAPASIQREDNQEDDSSGWGILSDIYKAVDNNKYLDMGSIGGTAADYGLKSWEAIEKAKLGPLASEVGESAGDLSKMLNPTLTTAGKIAGGASNTIGIITGLMDVAGPKKSLGEQIYGGLSMFSGVTGLMGDIAPGLFGAGGTAGYGASLGAAFGGAGGWAGAATALGSAGAVVGAGLAGFEAGKLMDSMMDVQGDLFLGDKTYADVFNEQILGQDPSLSPIRKGEVDHSYTGIIGDTLSAIDNAITAEPEDPDTWKSSQTIGHQINDWLES